MDLDGWMGGLYGPVFLNGWGYREWGFGAFVAVKVGEWGPLFFVSGIWSLGIMATCFCFFRPSVQM